ncbi:tetratricopeptide repeat protein [Spartinivicinus poritis]|uniref:Tetratricopeptide repeat protein n=1 Tax=Spartinivicinus poritis TaxID=2994640 RepID=A0ABT5U7Z3_9GAMM|nr:tetratricopeptide repeat protein [Spartinivicinus sp. A2-2]MDE1461637.1 tetratricopeptide repeat protein [Spartinivicinus sp. A2-2]
MSASQLKTLYGTTEEKRNNNGWSCIAIKENKIQHKKVEKEKSNEYLQKAKEHLYSTESIPYLEKAVAFNPKNLEALELLMNSYNSFGTSQKALDLSNQILNIDKHDYEAKLGKVQALSNLGRCNDAMDIINQILRVNPLSSPAWRNQSKCQTTLGLYTLAMQSISNSITIYPVNIDWAIKSLLHEIFGETVDAEYARKKALEEKYYPEWFDKLKVNLKLCKKNFSTGGANSKKNASCELISVQRKKLSPNQIVNFNNLNKSTIKKYSFAYSALIKIDTGYRRSMLEAKEYALTIQKNIRNTKAAELYKASLKMPYKEEVEALEKAVALNPHHALAQIKICNIYARVQAFSAAEKHCRIAYSYDNSNADIFFNILLALTPRKCDEALDLINDWEVRGLQGSYSPSLQKSICLMHTQKLELALETINDFLKDSPSDGYGWAVKSKIFELMGESDKAIAARKKALSSSGFKEEQFVYSGIEPR